MAETILFKKYPNRRIYNTEKSEYVSLVELGDLIKDGRDVKVVEVKTGDDVTAFTLTQIILEKAKQKNTLLPVPLLHLIIRHGENLLAEFYHQARGEGYRIGACQRENHGRGLQWIHRRGI